jgi:hypothetical protein
MFGNALFLCLIFDCFGTRVSVRRCRSLFICRHDRVDKAFSKMELLDYKVLSLRLYTFSDDLAKEHTELVLFQKLTEVLLQVIWG